MFELQIINVIKQPFHNEQIGQNFESAKVYKKIGKINFFFIFSKKSVCRNGKIDQKKRQININKVWKF